MGCRNLLSGLNSNHHLEPTVYTPLVDFQGKMLYPPAPHFGQKAFLRERMGGLYFEHLRGKFKDLIYPLFDMPPTPRRVFSGVGGGGGA